jgi:hypothetical protein
MPPMTNPADSNPNSLSRLLVNWTSDTRMAGGRAGALARRANSDGQPQLGHETARSEISELHSIHFTSAMSASPSADTYFEYQIGSAKSILLVCISFAVAYSVFSDGTAVPGWRGASRWAASTTKAHRAEIEPAQPSANPTAPRDWLFS